MSSSSTSSSSSSSIAAQVHALEWEQYGANVCDLDDGHIPEGFRSSNKRSGKNTGTCTSTSTTSSGGSGKTTTTTATDDGGPIVEDQAQHRTRLIDYPQVFTRQSDVHVFPNALSNPALVDAMYDYTVRQATSSWGDYVTMEQIQDYWQKQHDSTTTFDALKTNLIALVARYLQLVLGEDESVQDSSRAYATHPDTTTAATTTTTTTTSATTQVVFSRDSRNDDKDPTPRAPSPLWTRDKLDAIHGVAVWGLSAEVGSQVPYHLDYAEQIRYETNFMVPPLLAGTLQCSRHVIEGGDFWVSMDGLEHYQKHGYKSQRLPLSDSDPTAICVPYRFNQLTCHRGHLPHWSSKIESIHGYPATTTSSQLPPKRVIVGFNAFGKDVGPIVAQAPEHSESFRQLIRQRRRTQNKQRLSLQSVQSNKPLARLLVLAKRAKVQQDYRLAWKRLAQDIPRRLPTTVASLCQTFGNAYPDFSWPATPLDIQVFLKHQLQDGNYHRIQGDDDEDGDDENNEHLVPLTWTIALTLQ